MSAKATLENGQKSTENTWRETVQVTGLSEEEEQEGAKEMREDILPERLQNEQRSSSYNFNK